MNNGANPKSVDTQPIWLKSIRSGADWLDLTNPLLKEGIKSGSRADLQWSSWGIAPSLSPPHVWTLLDALWTDVSVYGLMCQLNQAPGWQVVPVQLQICIDWLSISWFDLIPWELHPPGLDLLIFVYIQAQQPLWRVRTGIEVLLLFYCCYCSFEIKRSFGGKTVLCYCMCGWSLPLFYWGNLYLCSWFANCL